MTIRSGLSPVLAGLVSCLAVAAVDAAEIVVIESTAPGIESGSILDSAATVSVPAGSFIVVVEEDGSSRTIDGPWDAPLAAAATDGGGGLVASLGKLVAERETEHQVLGAIRAAPGQVALDSFVVDITRTGPVCVPDGGAPVLWRPGTMAAESEITLTAPDGTSARLLWPDGAQRLAWPESLPAGTGARYAVRLATAPRPVGVELRRIPADIVAGPAQAAWMYEQGCVSQAGKVLADATRPAG
ncbi:MAG: hypothetical protein VYB54_04075 [Pseudomonadota bacterium]|nr:hypothetical protein [Pseudomonadota bacterium]